MSAGTIYTIGHSTHSAEFFLELLQDYSINCLVDVRSIAASRYNPQFNKAALSVFLKSNRITYLHFAKEFGARRNDPVLLDNNGKVNFEKVKQTPEFRAGIERLKAETRKGYTIALMCAEADPINCHRFFMISGTLEQAEFEVVHILKDKSLQSNKELELQLIKANVKQLGGTIFDLPGNRTEI